MSPALRNTRRLLALAATVASAGVSIRAQDAAVTTPAPVRAPQASVRVDGDVLTFLLEEDTVAVSVSFLGQLEPLVRLPDSNHWSLTKKLTEVSAAVFSYELLIGPEAAGTGVVVWRGPEAPAAPARARPVTGTCTVHRLMSAALGEERTVTVYRPPVDPGGQPWRVIYSADGQGAAEFAQWLEPLIVAGRVPPTLLVGAHSGEYRGPVPVTPQNYDPALDMRAAEYMPDFDPERFEAHAAFFTEELVAWAEENLHASSRREHRALFGYSNGARLVVTLGLQHPELYGSTLAFSVAGGKLPPFEATTLAKSSFYLAAGTWETGFLANTTVVHEALSTTAERSRLVPRVGGHDEAWWHEEFPAAVLFAFGPP